MPVSTTRPNESSTYPLTLLALYIAAWIALAIAPNDRHDWMLENVLPLLAIPLLVFSYAHIRFSRTAYTLLWMFMLLHAVGAHYTYAQVPYDDWSQRLTGHRFNDLVGWQRNNFDRVVHFLYGALLFPVFWELFAPRVHSGRAVQYLLIGAFIMSHAGIYEVIEWFAADFFGGDLGVAYLGTQGDEWDAQKDMALAMVGTLLAITVSISLRRK